MTDYKFYRQVARVIAAVSAATAAAPKPTPCPVPEQHRRLVALPSKCGDPDCYGGIADTSTAP